MRFSSFFVLATAVVSGFAQTVAVIEADIADISSKVTSLDNSINAYPSSGGTLAGALAIHTAAVALNSTIATATGHVNSTPGPVSDSDSSTILNAVTAFVPTIHHALVQIVVKKPAFDALPLGGISALVKQDLAALRATTHAFANALILKASTAYVSEATSLRDTIDGYFVTAQAGYP